jgi:hypothetical protein
MPASEILARQLAKVSLNFKKTASSIAIDAIREGLSKKATKDAVEKASPKSELLKRVFKEGVEHVDKKELSALFSKARKLWRYDSNPEELAKIGFKPGRVTEVEGSANIPGIYYADRKKELNRFLGLSKKSAPDVEIITNPEAITRRVPNNTEGTIAGADFVKRYNDPLNETIQQNPGQALARIKLANGTYEYKVIGAIGALAGGSLALDQNNEAEAGTLSKATQAIAKGAESSASKALKGTSFKEGIIEKIVKGKGDWRYIFNQGVDEPFLVDKNVVNSLARSNGTSKQIEKFSLADEESKLAQAYKSLEMHKSKADVDPNVILDYHSNYAQQLNLAGQQAPSMSLVKSEGKHFTLPTEYAKLLDKEGALKLIKDLNK